MKVAKETDNYIFNCEDNSLAKVDMQMTIKQNKWRTFVFLMIRMNLFAGVAIFSFFFSSLFDTKVNFLVTIALFSIGMYVAIKLVKTLSIIFPNSIELSDDGIVLKGYYVQRRIPLDEITRVKRKKGNGILFYKASYFIDYGNRTLMLQHSQYADLDRFILELGHRLKTSVSK